MQAELCFFSVGIDQLPRKEQGDLRAVLTVLAETKRFSSFEATANGTIASTMDRLGNEGYYRVIGGSYPWVNIEITSKGWDLLEVQAAKG